MENQVSAFDFIENFGRAGASIFTFAGPIIISLILALIIYLLKRSQARKNQINILAREIEKDQDTTPSLSQQYAEPFETSLETLEQKESKSTENPKVIPGFEDGLAHPSRGSQENADQAKDRIDPIGEFGTSSSKNAELERTGDPSAIRKSSEQSIQPMNVLNEIQASPVFTQHEQLPNFSPQDKSDQKNSQDSRLTTSTPSWIDRLKLGLTKTRSQLSSSLADLFASKPKLEGELLDKFHESIYKADMGLQIADLLVDSLRRSLTKPEQLDLPNIIIELKKKIAEIFAESDKPENIPEPGPRVILIVGVNGVGKTTTVGKLAAWQIKQNQKVLLCAADTFRAAAIDQLAIWAERVGVPIIAHKQGADPAAVAFDGVKAAKAREVDTLIIDTAGRLHNKIELMAELGKVTKVIKKEIPAAPHETWIVVDATTGQNAIQQVKAFGEVTPLTGVIITKLDGTAKGGIVAAISHQFALPIRYIGVGEDAEDLRPFKSDEFISSLF